MAADEKDNGLSAASEYVQIFMINVSIEKATDLRKADTFGKSDPYLRVTANGQTYTTNTIMKTLDPVWNEKTTFVFFNDPGKLHFEVWDWDRGTKDDSLGDVDLSLNGFFNEGNPGFNGQLKLENTKKGEIYVSVSCRKLVPSELENKAKQLTQETEEQKEEIIKLNENINNTKIENENLTNENQTLKTNIEQTKNKIDETEKDIEARKQTQKELNEELEQAEKERNVANDKLDAAKKDLKETETEINKLRDDLEKAKEENENLEHESAELERQLKEEKERAEREKRAAKESKSSSKHKQQDSTVALTADDEPINVAPANKGCCVVL